MQYIGQDFSKQIKLNLLPMSFLPSGYYQAYVSWSNHDNDSQLTQYNFTSFETTGTTFAVIIGRDVKEISVVVTKLDGLFSVNMPITYVLRVDHLLMLNIVSSFLGL